MGTAESRAQFGILLQRPGGGQGSVDGARGRDGGRGPPWGTAGGWKSQRSCRGGRPEPSENVTVWVSGKGWRLCRST